MLVEHGRLYLITFTKEVTGMFPMAFVHLLTSRIMQKNDLTDVQNIQWKGGTWATEESIRF